MSTRLEIELTSTRPDGTWTWRKAGAKLPKGELSGSLLPESAKVGDVLKAEADVAVDGTEILGILAGRAPKQPQHQMLEVIGRQRNEELVTTKLAGKGRRRDRNFDGDDRGDRKDRPRRDRTERSGADRDRSGGPRPERRPRSGPSEPMRPRPKRLRPSRAHRSAVLADLSPETRRIAEEVLKGGVPAVRAAIDKQNELNRAQGMPEINKDELVALAESLLPKLRSAEWRDRADAAMATIEDLDLRDLRSVVVAADAGARDDESRALAGELQAALTRRVEAEHGMWMADLAAMIEQGRVVRALRLSSRPVKPGNPLPSDMTAKLVAQTAENLTADTPPARWATVLDALAFSPIRTAVLPTAPPAEITDELKEAVVKVASRLPAIAELLGVDPNARPPKRKRDGGPRQTQQRRSPRQPSGGESASGSAEGSAEPVAEPAEAPTSDAIGAADVEAREPIASAEIDHGEEQAETHSNDVADAGAVEADVPAMVESDHGQAMADMPQRDEDAEPQAEAVAEERSGDDGDDTNPDQGDSTA